MLNYVDVAMATFLRRMFPEVKPDGTPYFTVVYAHPEASRQSLAAVKENEDIGIPGLSVFRTDIAKDEERFTMPRAHHGIPFGRNEGDKKWSNLRVIPVTAEYTVKAWSRDLVDLATIERELNFSDIYTTISWKIQGNIIHWFLKRGDISYETIIQKDTGKAQFHNLTMVYHVDTNWIKTTEVPWIESIKVNFNSILSGVPLEIEETDKFELSFEPTVSSIDIEFEFTEWTGPVPFQLSLLNLDPGTVTVQIDGVIVAHDKYSYDPKNVGFLRFARQINLIEIDGTPSPGDIVSLSIQNPSFLKRPVDKKDPPNTSREIPIVVSYTILDDDDTDDIATALSNLINANAVLTAWNITSTISDSIINLMTSDPNLENKAKTTTITAIISNPDDDLVTTETATETVDIGDPITKYALWAGEIDYKNAIVTIQAVDIPAPDTVDLVISGIAKVTGIEQP